MALGCKGKPIGKKANNAHRVFKLQTVYFCKKVNLTTNPLKTNTMKQHYLFFLLLLTPMAFAQDLRLFEHTWYLTELTQDGISQQPPNNEEVPNVPLNFSQEMEMQVMGTNVCNYTTGSAEYGNANTVWFRDYAITLIMCNSWANQTFEQQYFGFFTEHYPNDIFNYEIFDIGDLLTLVLTSESGDQARYSNYNLATKPFAQCGFSIQPNPAHDFIDLKLENLSLGNTTVEIYNTLGAQCKSEKVISPMHQISVTDLSAGMYIVILKSETETYTGKFLKK